MNQYLAARLGANGRVGLPSCGIDESRSNKTVVGSAWGRSAPIAGPPSPDDSFKAGARVFPTLVPTTTDDLESAFNIDAWSVLAGFDKPLLTCFSDQDPITRGGEQLFLANVPGSQGQPHTTIAGVGHFLQEDRGIELAVVINDFIAASPRSTYGDWSVRNRSRADRQ